MEVFSYILAEEVIMMEISQTKKYNDFNFLERGCHPPDYFVKSKVVGKRCLKLLRHVHELVVSVELKAFVGPQDIFIVAPQ